MAAGAGKADERDLLGGEELVDQCNALRSVAAVTGGVDQFDSAEDMTGPVRGEDEVDVLVRDQVERGLATALGADFEEVGEAGLDRDLADGADEWFKDSEKVPLGGGHEMLLPSHPAELHDAPAVVA